MSYSVEYRTLSRCRDKLVTAFKLDAGTLADTFVSHNLISPAIASEVNELVISEQKARRLVDSVFDKVKLSYTNYESFMTVFSQFVWLNDLVRILNSTHSK
jgi:ABC-type sugar transport system ATPase subunit